MSEMYKKWGLTDFVLERTCPEEHLNGRLIVLVSPNWSDRKGDDKVSNCKFKKYLFGEKATEKPVNFPTR